MALLAQKVIQMQKFVIKLGRKREIDWLWNETRDWNLSSLTPTVDYPIEHRRVVVRWIMDAYFTEVQCLFDGGSERSVMKQFRLGKQDEINRIVFG